MKKSIMYKVTAIMMVAVLAIAMFCGASVNAATTDTPSAVDIHRLSGNDRIQTAGEIASAFSNSLEAPAQAVVIANGFNYPDALAGVPFAKSINAPILLTHDSYLDAATMAKIKELSPSDVYILGGEFAVARSIEDELSKNYKTVRLAGENRFETALEIAREFEAHGDTIVVVSGENYPDALSISPAAGILKAPIIFSNKNGTFTTSTIQYIKDEGFSKAVIAGGGAAVGDNAIDLLEALGLNVKRVYGNDRYATSAAIFRYFDNIYDDDIVTFAAGTNFPDALAGGVLSAELNAPILLVANNSNNKTIEEAIVDKPIKAAYVYGGVNAVSDNTLNNLLDGDISTQPTSTTTTTTTTTTTKATTKTTTTTTTKKTTKPTTATTKPSKWDTESGVKAALSKCASYSRSIGCTYDSTLNASNCGYYGSASQVDSFCFDTEAEFVAKCEETVRFYGNVKGFTLWGYKLTPAYGGYSVQLYFG